MSAFSRELRSFITVSQSTSIREAATRLNISAPALSRQMQILERSYGTDLLTRTSTGIALTPDGEHLRAQALDWFAAEAKINQRMRQKQQRAGIHLRIGVMECFVETVIPGFAERLEKAFGPVELDLIRGSTDDLIAMAERNELDIVAAFNMPTLTRLIIVNSYDYHLGVVYSPTLGPEGEGPISLQAALDWPLCLPSSGLSIYNRLLAEILSVRVNPEVALNTNSINAILMYLRHGKGVSILTWLDVAREVEAGHLRFRPLANKRLTETLSIAICRGNALGDKTGLVIDHLDTAIKAVGR